MISPRSSITLSGDHITEDPSLDNSEIRLPARSPEAKHFATGDIVKVTNKAKHRSVPMVVSIDDAVTAAGNDMVRLNSAAAKNLKVAGRDRVTIHGLPKIKEAERIVIIPVSDTLSALPDELSPLSILEPYFANSTRPVCAKEFIFTTTSDGSKLDFFITEVSPGPCGLVTDATSVHANCDGVAIERADAEGWASGRTLSELHHNDAAPLPRDPEMAPDKLEKKDAAMRPGTFKRFWKNLAE